MFVDTAFRSAALAAQLNSQTASAREASASFSLATSTAGTVEENTAAVPESKREALLKELKDYIDKGPVAALREKILKSMGLTEDELKAKSPEDQKLIEAEIAEKIKEFLLKQQGEHKPQQATTKVPPLYETVARL